MLSRSAPNEDLLSRTRDDTSSVPQSAPGIAISLSAADAAKNAANLLKIIRVAPPLYASCRRTNSTTAAGAGREQLGAPGEPAGEPVTPPGALGHSRQMIGGTYLCTCPAGKESRIPVPLCPSALCPMPARCTRRGRRRRAARHGRPASSGRRAGRRRPRGRGGAGQSSPLESAPAGAGSRAASSTWEKLSSPSSNAPGLVVLPGEVADDDEERQADRDADAGRAGGASDRHAGIRTAMVSGSAGFQSPPVIIERRGSVMGRCSGVGDCRRGWVLAPSRPVGRGFGYRAVSGSRPVRTRPWLPINGVPVLERVEDETVAVDLVDDTEWGHPQGAFALQAVPEGASAVRVGDQFVDHLFYSDLDLRVPYGSDRPGELVG